MKKILIVTAILTFLFAEACQAKPLEIKIWTVFGRQPHQRILEGVFKRFEAANPDIKVTHVVPASDSGPYYDKLLTAMVGGVGPDIAWVVPSTIRGFVEKGGVMSLPELQKLGGSIQINDFYKGLTTTRFNYKKTLWGIPFENGNLALAWNKQMFAQAGLNRPPHTWSEMTQYCLKLTQREKKIFGFEGRYWPWYFDMWLFQKGVFTASDDGTKILWAEKPAIEAVQWYTDLMLKHRVASENALFFSRTAAMAIIGNYEYPSLKSLKWEYGIAPLPHADDGVPATLSTYKELAIFNGRSKQKIAAAWKLAKFMIEDSNFTQWCTATGYLPVRKSQAATPEMQRFLSANPGLATFLDQADDALVGPTIKNGRSVGPVWDKAISSILRGEKSVEAALTDSARQAQALIRR